MCGCMRVALLAAYLAVNAYDRAGDMGNDPEEQQRNAAAASQLSFEGLSSTGMKADIDAGRYAIGNLSQLSGYLPPSQQQMVEELAEVAGPSSARIYQFNPGLSLSMLARRSPCTGSDSALGSRRLWKEKRR